MPARCWSWCLPFRSASSTPRNAARTCTRTVWNWAANWTCGHSSPSWPVCPRASRRRCVRPSSVTRSRWCLVELRAADWRRSSAVWSDRTDYWRTSSTAVRRCTTCWSLCPVSISDSWPRRFASLSAGSVHLFTFAPSPRHRGYVIDGLFSFVCSCVGRMPGTAADKFYKVSR